MGHNRYKYDGTNTDFVPTIGVNIRVNPNQIGMFVEESHVVTPVGANYTIDCNNYLATEIHSDFVIPDFAVGHTSFGSWAQATAYGIVYVKNVSETPNIYLTNAVDFVGWSGNKLTFNTLNISDNDVLEIGYYAIGVGYKSDGGGAQPADVMLRPDLTVANSFPVTKESIQCLVRAMDTKSPIDLPKLGYKWAHIFAVVTKTNEFEEIVLDTTATVGVGTPDYMTDYDRYLPIFVTELRCISPHTSLRISADFQGEQAWGGDINDKIGAFIDFANTSLCYRTSVGECKLFCICTVGSLSDQTV